MKKLQILGTGCAKCTKLAEMSDRAARELQIEYSMEKISDLNDIMSFGVMMTPALVVDGEVKTAGKIPDLDTLKKLIT